MIADIKNIDLQQVAQLHKKNLPSIISFYSEKFVKKFYHFHLNKKADETIFKGYFEDKKLIGFVFGTYELDQLFDDFIGENKPFFIVETLKALVAHPVYFVHLFGKVFGAKTASTCKTQLVYIAVDKNQNGKGIGKKLLESFENEAKNKVDYYELEVEKNNPALQFYLKNNFSVVEEINSVLEKKYLMGKRLK